MGECSTESPRIDRVGLEVREPSILGVVDPVGQVEHTKMTMGNITILPLSRSMVPAVGALFEKVYGRRFNAEFYSWRFLENPFGPTMVLLAFDGDRIVSHYAVCPSEARTPSGGSLRGAQSMTTMTDPDYGGRGLFPRLAEHLYRTINEEHGTEFVFGFPNANSHYAFTQKLGWEDVHPLFFMTKAVDGGVDSDFQLLRWSDLDPVLNIHKTSQIGYQPYTRSREFIRWRYQHNPEQSYAVVAPPGPNDASVVAIVKEFTHGHGGASLDIVDILGEHDPTLLRSVIEAATSFARSKTLTTVQTWLDLYHPAFTALERLRFRPIGPITYFGIRFLSTGSAKNPDPREWRVTMGDSDVF